MNLDNQPLVSGPGPAENAFPDFSGIETVGLNVEKIIETAKTKNWLSFVKIVAKDWAKQLQTETNNTGVSLFPFIQEEQIKKDAEFIAQEIFAEYKKNGYLDNLNRFSEKFYNLKEAQNAS